jgi:hypothetical protein
MTTPDLPQNYGIKETHLRLRWEKAPVGEGEWLCHYELVLALDQYDMRREIVGDDGEQIADVPFIVLRMGRTAQRGSNRSPCNDGWDPPFRGGAHAKWDAAKLGDLPIYCISPGGQSFANPYGKKATP